MSEILVGFDEFLIRLERARRYRHRPVAAVLTIDDRRVIAKLTGNAGGHYLVSNNTSRRFRRVAIAECSCAGPEHDSWCPHRVENIRYR